MKQFFSLLTCGLMCVHAAFGQYDAAVRLIQRIPQHATDLPASSQEYRAFVGVPGLSSVLLHMENGVMYPGQILRNTPAGTAIDLDALRSMWRGTNRLGVDAQVEVLHVGFRAGTAGFFTFSMRERLAFRADVPSDLLLLPLEGTLGGVRWEDASLRLDHFRESALGWQRSWGQRLRTGIRAKVLYGYEHADLHGVTGGLTTDSESWAWNVTGGGTLRTAGIDTWESGTPLPNQYLTGLRNRGLALDVGVGTSLGTKTTLDLGCVDFGSIRWKSGNKVWTVEPGTWQFTGLNLGTVDPAAAADAVSDTLDVWTDAVVEQLEGQFALTESEGAFRAALPARFNLTVRHRLVDRPRSRGTAVLTASQESGAYGPGNGAVTIGWCHEFGNVLALAATAGMLREGPPTAGAALALNLGPLQFHVAADNVLLLRTVELNLDEERIPVPAAAAVHHLRFGLNLTFGQPIETKNRRHGPPPTSPPATTRRPAEAHLNPRPAGVPCALPGSKTSRHRH